MCIEYLCNAHISAEINMLIVCLEGGKVVMIVYSVFHKATALLICCIKSSEVTWSWCWQVYTQNQIMSGKLPALLCHLSVVLSMKEFVSWQLSQLNESESMLQTSVAQLCWLQVWRRLIPDWFSGKLTAQVLCQGNQFHCCSSSNLDGKPCLE